jgi:hypothetical protein
MKSKNQCTLLYTVPVSGMRQQLREEVPACINRDSANSLDVLPLLGLSNCNVWAEEPTPVMYFQ